MQRVQGAMSGKEISSVRTRPILGFSKCGQIQMSRCGILEGHFSMFYIFNGEKKNVIQKSNFKLDFQEETLTVSTKLKNQHLSPKSWYNCYTSILISQLSPTALAVNVNQGCTIHKLGQYEMCRIAHSVQNSKKQRKPREPTTYSYPQMLWL